MDRIGFIGLGIMGKPMALHLLRAGYPLVVLNRSPGPQNELVSAGATADASPKHVAEQSDVVITMLPDSPDVDQVILGKEGVLEGLVPGGLIIDMSTVLPSLARRIADTAQQKRCAALDAPVSGGQVGRKMRPCRSWLAGLKPHLSVRSRYFSVWEEHSLYRRSRSRAGGKSCEPDCRRGDNCRGE